MDIDTKLRQLLETTVFILGSQVRPKNVKLGEVINCRRADTSLEAVFEELRGHLALTNVTDEAFEIRRVPVDSVRYTCESCPPTFRCDKLLGTTTQEFVD